MKTLEQSEAVWQSKQQFIKVSTSTVLEEVGEITGWWNHLQQFAAEEKAKIVEQIKQNWLNQIEELKKKFFFDSKNQYHAEIGWGEKNGFVQELPGKVSSVSKSLDSEIGKLTNQLLKEFNVKHLHSVQIFNDLFDSNLKFNVMQEKESLLAGLKDEFDRELDPLSDSNTLNLFRGLNSKVEEWSNRFGWISWEEVAKFRDEGLTKIEQRVELVINDRLAMLQKVVKWALTFYNYFLNTQKRYQQETPEQRTAEKAWIDQQRQQLKQLLASVEISLK